MTSKLRQKPRLKIERRYAVNTRKFEYGISVGVVVGREGLSIRADDTLIIPPGITPNAFSLILTVPINSPVVFCQKDIGQDEGRYNYFLGQMDLNGQRMLVSPVIQVVRAGRKVWTSWHQEKPNRVDCWHIWPDGKVSLFQVGVITHDNGKTWRLLGEYRWKGQLFQDGQGIVGKPETPAWGGFENRRMILTFSTFGKPLVPPSWKPGGAQKKN